VEDAPGDRPAIRIRGIGRISGRNVDEELVVVLPLQDQAFLPWMEGGDARNAAYRPQRMYEE
jgi:uncharacterized protein (UPF0210 family)